MTCRTPGAVGPGNPLGVQFDPFGRRGPFCKDCTKYQFGKYLERLADVDPVYGIQRIPGTSGEIMHYPRAYPRGDAANLPVPARPRMSAAEVTARARHWIVQDFCKCLTKLYENENRPAGHDIPFFRKCHGTRCKYLHDSHYLVLLTRWFCVNLAVGANGLGKAGTAHKNRRRRRFTPLECPCGKDTEMPAGNGRLFQNYAANDPVVNFQMVTFCMVCHGVRVDPNLGDIY